MVEMDAGESVGDFSTKRLESPKFEFLHHEFALGDSVAQQNHFSEFV